MFPVFNHITAKRPGESIDMLRVFCCIYGGSNASHPKEGILKVILVTGIEGMC